MNQNRQFNSKDIYAAIQVVDTIVDSEDFLIGVVDDVDGLNFALIDRQDAYLGNIGADRFGDLGAVLDRMDTYHNDYFYVDYDERVAEGEEIPQDDYDRKILIFLEDDFCQNLISSIDVKTYQKFRDVELAELKLNPGEIERYVKDGAFDAVGYLCDKAIAYKIMDTQSAYPMAEFGDNVYVAAHGDWYANVDEMLSDLSTGETSFCNGYYTYGSLIECELSQVFEDMYDIGLYNEKDYSFYLSEYELEYIGLSDELQRYKEQEPISGINHIIDAAKERAAKTTKESSCDKTLSDNETKHL